jgi:hypothetical protein
VARQVEPQLVPLLAEETSQAILSRPARPVFIGIGVFMPIALLRGLFLMRRVERVPKLDTI